MFIWSMDELSLECVDGWVTGIGADLVTTKAPPIHLQKHLERERGGEWEPTLFVDRFIRFISPILYFALPYVDRCDYEFKHILL